MEYAQDFMHVQNLAISSWWLLTFKEKSLSHAIVFCIEPTSSRRLVSTFFTISGIQRLQTLWDSISETYVKPDQGQIKKQASWAATQGANLQGVLKPLD